MAASTAPSPKPNNVSYSYSMELVLHNSDLVTEILLWVPAKSLVKFQSVCREWLSLISSTEFRQQHTIRCLQLQHPQPQQSLILQTALPPKWFHLKLSSRRMTSFSLSLHDEKHIIIQSSNGLLLLQPYLRSRDYYVYVHNLATKQSRKIMIPPRPPTHPHVADVALAFDPSKSPYYELVCIRHSSNRAEAVTDRIDVYTSKSHTWKELTLEPSLLPTSFGIAFTQVFRHRVRVYWNNAIYWSFERLPFYCCFDIAKREMKILDCPATDHRGEENNAYNWFLRESDGHLFHVELMKGEDWCDVAAVWELDDDHHWLLRHHHVLTSTAPAPPERWERLHSTSFIYLVDTCSLLVCRDGWRVYSLNTGSFEDFLDATDFRPKYPSAFQFGGTLALV